MPVCGIIIQGKWVAASGQIPLLQLNYLLNQPENAMKDLCVPVSHFGDDEIAEISLTIGGRKSTYNFRVESFPWEVEDELSRFDDQISLSLARIERLKNAIRNYDPEWELIQIFTPGEDSKHIQVLYRKKKS